ncbi:MAG TPA: GNAT family N-acetyltransferase [Chitinispirillaceae bacterium]|nr:GNAT family N-acetyltransferase [Chitinispirillaceae bacterium]
MFFWKPLEIQDISDVVAIAHQIHPQLPERAEVLREKVVLYPQGCKKLLVNSKIVGYALAHPWCQNSIPSLDNFLGKLPDYPDCLYLHDIAILKTARGRGAAAHYVAELIKMAKQRSYSKIALVSVYGTTGFWEKHGFSVVNSASVEKKLESYGETACYMQYCLQSKNSSFDHCDNFYHSGIN